LILAEKIFIPSSQTIQTICVDAGRSH